MTRIKLVLLALAAMTAGSASANTIIVTGLNGALGLQQSLYFDEDGVSTQAYWVGAIIISLDGYTRDTFCVDLFTDISFNSYNSMLEVPNSDTQKRIGWLLENQFPTTAIQGAAFQLALWDITHDNGDGFDAGRITKSSNAAHPTNPLVLAAASAYEAASVGMSSTYGVVYHNTTFNGVAVQNLIGLPVTDGGPSAMPEPADVVLIGSGLLLIVLGRQRWRRSAR